MVKYSPRLCNRRFEALADSTQCRIRERLDRDSGSVIDLALSHSISLPAVPRHLRTLEHAGLIRRLRSGGVKRLPPETVAVRRAVHWIDAHRRFRDGGLDC